MAELIFISFSKDYAGKVALEFDKLNNRPRKSLNWKTPNEVFFGLEIAA